MGLITVSKIARHLSAESLSIIGEEEMFKTFDILGPAFL